MKGLEDTLFRYGEIVTSKNETTSREYITGEKQNHILVYKSKGDIVSSSVRSNRQLSI